MTRKQKVGYLIICLVVLIFNCGGLYQAVEARGMAVQNELGSAQLFLFTVFSAAAAFILMFFLFEPHCKGCGYQINSDRSPKFCPKCGVAVVCGGS